MTQSVQKGPEGTEPVTTKTAHIAMTEDCFLIATVVDTDGNIQLFSNGTKSKQKAREALTKVLNALGPETQELAVAV